MVRAAERGVDLCALAWCLPTARGPHRTCQHQQMHLAVPAQRHLGLHSSSGISCSGTFLFRMGRFWAAFAIASRSRRHSSLLMCNPCCHFSPSAHAECGVVGIPALIDETILRCLPGKLYARRKRSLVPHGSMRAPLTVSRICWPQHRSDSSGFHISHCRNIPKHIS
jgi:hypothetical protein